MPQIQPHIASTFQNFPGSMPPDPLALACYACSLYFV